VALVLVLWVLVLLMVIAGALSTTQRNEVSMVTAMLKERRGRAAIAAAHYYMIYRLKLPQMEGAEEEWKADGVLRSWRFGDIELGISALPENGRIDLNQAAPELIEKLFVEAGAEEQEAIAIRDAILDWKDPDDAHRLDGAEDDDYEAAGFAYGARDGPFETIEELRMVMGVTPELYRAVSPALTIHAAARTVNPIFSQPLAVYALPGLDRSAADQYIAQRNDALQQGLEPEMPAGVDGLAGGRAAVRNYRLYAETRGEASGIRGEMVISLAPTRRGLGRQASFSVLERSFSPASGALTSIVEQP
jgi:general secretion pathway protein K